MRHWNPITRVTLTALWHTPSYENGTLQTVDYVVECDEGPCPDGTTHRVVDGAGNEVVPPSHEMRAHDELLALLKQDLETGV